MHICDAPALRRPEMLNKIRRPDLKQPLLDEDDSSSKHLEQAKARKKDVNKDSKTGRKKLPTGSREICCGPEHREQRGIYYGKLGALKGGGGETFRGNAIRTAKYTWYSFLPVALLRQFRRLGNQYFLLQTVIMVVGEYSDLYPSPLKSWSQIAVLSFVLGLSMIFEARDDIFRHKKDYEVNNSICCHVEFSYEEKKQRRGIDDRVVTSSLASAGSHGGMGGGGGGFRNRGDTTSSSVNVAADDFEDYLDDGGSSRVNRSTNTGGQSQLERSYRSQRTLQEERWEIKDTTWSKVAVGDLVIVRRDEAAPADFVILATGTEDGLCYVETSNIDGETNLKLRQSPLAAAADGCYRDYSRSRGLSVALALNRASYEERGEKEEEEEEKEEEDDGKEQEQQHHRFFSKEEALRQAVGWATSLDMKCVVEKPNRSVNTLKGYLELMVKTEDNGQKSEEEDAKKEKPSPSTITRSIRRNTLPLTGRNLVIRGSIIRNTAWCVGLCVYTGDDTKIMQNSTETPSKLSNIDKILNRTLYIIVMTQAILVTATDVAGLVWRKEHLGKKDDGGTSGIETYYSAWYLLPGPNSTEADSFVFPPWLSNWLAFFILFNNFVPINLYVILDFVNMLQAVMITNDLKMYDEATDSPATCRSTNLCQEIGQVQHIFSDKTGTLTQNLMVFRTCAIGGKAYGSFPEDISPMIDGGGDGPSKDEEGCSGFIGQNTDSKERRVVFEGGGFNHDDKASSRGSSHVKKEMSSSLLTPISLLHESLVLQRNEMKDRSGLTHSLEEDFLLALAVCHTVVIDEKGEIQAESPDEAALVRGASEAGYRFIGRKGNVVSVRVAAGTITTTSTTTAASAGNGAEDEGEEGEGVDRRLEGPVAFRNSKGRPEQHVVLKFTVLGVNTFSSKRKRMSVVVRCPDGSVRVIVKGADSVIYERLRRSSNHDSHDEKGEEGLRKPGTRVTSSTGAISSTSSSSSSAAVRDNVNKFAMKGLRTLAIAQRKLEEDELRLWKKEYDTAAAAVSNRKELLEAAADKVESSGLTLLGATGIEDKLQDDVARTITDIQAAGITFWVLTGDKPETAINIGYSSGVLKPHSRIYKMLRLSSMPAINGVHIPLSGPQAASKELNRVYKQQKKHSHSQQRHRASKANSGAGYSLFQRRRNSSEHFSNSRILREVEKKRHSSSHNEQLLAVEEEEEEDDEEDCFYDDSVLNDQDKQLNETTGDHQALVVTGKVLEQILDNGGLRKKLLRVCRPCNVVVACRVSPLQKAQLVKMVREGVKPEPITLSIGDGANDVGMIQEAHIGVGISGREGRQAVNASDFAIAQFRFLKRLLLVHGRWNYRRICKVITYVFYKNFTITLTLLIYACMAGISGTSLYESLMYNGFNFFTMFPIIGVGTMDQDVRAETVESFPVLYVSGRLSEDLNSGIIIENILTAIIHAIIVVFLPYLSYSGLDQAGIGGLSVFGTMVFSCLVFLMQYRVMLITATYTKYTAYALLLSFFLYFLFLVCYGLMDFLNWEFYYVPYKMMGAPVFWIVLFGVPGTALYIDFFIKYVRRELCPTLMDIATEADYFMNKELETASGLTANNNVTTKFMKFLGIRLRKEVKNQQTAAAAAASKGTGHSSVSSPNFYSSSPSSSSRGIRKNTFGGSKDRTMVHARSPGGGGGQSSPNVGNGRIGDLVTYDNDDDSRTTVKMLVPMAVSPNSSIKTNDNDEQNNKKNDGGGDDADSSQNNNNDNNNNNNSNDNNNNNNFESKEIGGTVADDRYIQQPQQQQQQYGGGFSFSHPGETFMQSLRRLTTADDDDSKRGANEWPNIGGRVVVQKHQQQHQGANPRNRKQKDGGRRRRMTGPSARRRRRRDTSENIEDAAAAYDDDDDDDGDPDDAKYGNGRQQRLETHVTQGTNARPSQVVVKNITTAALEGGGGNSDLEEAKNKMFMNDEENSNGKKQKKKKKTNRPSDDPFFQQTLPSKRCIADAGGLIASQDAKTYVVTYDGHLTSSMIRDDHDNDDDDDVDDDDDDEDGRCGGNIIPPLGYGIALSTPAAKARKPTNIDCHIKPYNGG
eukprot:jgi/Bigna1/132164/aug1.16_g6872